MDLGDGAFIVLPLAREADPSGALAASHHGRSLIAAGFGADIAPCAAVDATDAVLERVEGSTDRFAPVGGRR